MLPFDQVHATVKAIPTTLILWGICQEISTAIPGARRFVLTYDLTHPLDLLWVDYPRIYHSLNATYLRPQSLLDSIPKFGPLSFFFLRRS